MTDSVAEEGETGAPVSKAIRVLLGLACVGGSLAGALVEIFLGDALDGFVSKNVLEARRALEVGVLLGAFSLAGPAMFALVSARRRGRFDDVLAWLSRWTTFLLPLSIAVFIPVLLRWRGWQERTLELLLFSTAVALFLEATLRRALVSVPASVTALTDAMAAPCLRLWARVPARAQQWTPIAIVVLAAVAYAVFASTFTILHHERLKTACFDLGQYDNLFFNALNGHPFRISSIGGEEDFGALRGHAEIGMYSVLPFYALKPGPEALLVIQCVLLASGAVALFLFARRFVSPWLSVLLALTYLLYAPMHRANFYDVHMQPIAAAYLLWMLYFLVARRPFLFALAFLCALTIREDVSIGLAILGASLIVYGFRPRLGLFIAVTSTLYFFTLKFYVMPKFGEWWFADIYKGLQIPGTEGYASVIETLASNPAFVFSTLLTAEKLSYALMVLAPLAFLPLRRPALALAIIPGSFFTLLTSGYEPTVSPNFQYNMVWVPYVFTAAAVALRALGGESPFPGPVAAGTARSLAPRRAAVVTLVFLAFITSFHYGAVFQQNTFVGGFTPVKFSITDAERARLADVRALASLIPPDASVAATDHLTPHVSTRVSVYCYRSASGGADYLLYDPKDARQKARENTKGLLRSGKFGLIESRGGIYLFRRGADTSKNAGIVDRL